MPHSIWAVGSPACCYRNWRASLRSSRLPFHTALDEPARFPLLDCVGKCQSSFFSLVPGNRWNDCCRDGHDLFDFEAARRDRPPHLGHHLCHQGEAAGLTLGSSLNKLESFFRYRPIQGMSLPCLDNNQHSRSPPRSPPRRPHPPPPSRTFFSLASPPQ